MPVQQVCKYNSVQFSSVTIIYVLRITHQIDYNFGDTHLLPAKHAKEIRKVTQR